MLLRIDVGNRVRRRVDNVVEVPFVPVFKDADMRVFPNPSAGSFSVRVSSTESSSMSIVVTDLLGRQVLTKSASTNTDVPINMDVANGWYVVAAIVDRRVLSEKMYLLRQTIIRLTKHTNKTTRVVARSEAARTPDLPHSIIL